MAVQELFKAAIKARDNAYAPDSGFKVGAAVRSASGLIYSGCNIENASYGLTICAERVAVFTAVAAGERQLEELLLVTDGETATAPCGACRQVMQEFDVKIVHMADKLGRVKSYQLAELLPLGFSRQDFKKMSDKI